MLISNIWVVIFLSVVFLLSGCLDSFVENYAFRSANDFEMTLPASSYHINAYIQNPRGNVKIFRSYEPYIKVSGNKSAYGSDEYSIDLLDNIRVNAETDKNTISVVCTSMDWNLTKVDIDLLLPSNSEYNISISVGKGDILVYRVKAQYINIVVNEGDIILKPDMVDGGIYTFETKNGDIEFIVPITQQYIFKLDATTINGEIVYENLPHLEYDHEEIEEGARLTVGMGPSSIRILTHNGNINIRSEYT